MNGALLKATSILIQYPDQGLKECIDEIEQVVKQEQSHELEVLVNYLKKGDLVELQQSYVEAFDFNRKATLYLSFHTYGDRRQRGMAMLKLKRPYREFGLELNEGELPDYLPVVLEFAANVPDETAVEALNQFRTSLELICSDLEERESPYAAALKIIIGNLPKLSFEQREAVKRAVAEGPTGEAVGLEPFAPPEVMPAMADCGGPTL